MSFWKNITRLFDPPREAEKSAANKQEEFLAVLPFKDLGGSGEWEHICDGIVEDLINDLSGVKGLHVVSRNSSYAFRKVKDIREIVQLAAIKRGVEGEISINGNDLVLKARLIGLPQGNCLWEQQYNGKTGEVITFLKDISLRILEPEGLEFDPHRSQSSINHFTKDFEVYNWYLKGRHHFNKRGEGLQLGTDCFNKALAIDPNYAPALAGLSYCYNLMGFYAFEDPETTFTKAKELAEKSLELNPKLVEGHLALAFCNFLYFRQWDTAELGFEKALELNPGYATTHHWYAEYLMAKGDHEEAIYHSSLAKKYDPLGLIVNTVLSMSYYFAGEFRRSIVEGEKILAMNPDYVPSYIWLGLSYCMEGEAAKAVALFEKGRILSQDKNLMILSLLAFAYARNSRSAEAEKLLNELSVHGKSNYCSSYDLARVQMGLKQKDKALEYLIKAFEERSTMLVWLNEDPVFKELAGMPEYERLKGRFQVDRGAGQ